MAKLVNWYSFRAKLTHKKLVLFTPLDVRRVLGVTPVATTFLLHRYSKQGFIVKLRRGLYAFPDARLPDPIIANKLYEPSYVSLEFALSYHRVIPEAVYSITSVSTKKTKTFEVMGKTFTYRSIKKDAFTGYMIQKLGGQSFFIASAEKAFVDANYYRYLAGSKPLSRFDKSKINLPKAIRYAHLFKQPKFISIITSTMR